MDLKHAKGTWLAWLCVALGVAITAYAAHLIVRGEGGRLLAAVGLPLLAYGALMLWAVRRVRTPDPPPPPP